MNKILLLLCFALLVGCGKKNDTTPLEPDHYPRPYPGVE